MNRISTLLIGSALSALLITPVLAADAAPASSQKIEPTAAAAPAPAAKPTTAALAAPATPAKESAAAPKEQPVKVGLIEMAKVASESTPGKAAEASIKTKKEKLQAKIEAKQKQLEKEKAAIEAKIETLSPKERAAKAKQFQKKVEEYQKLVRSSEEDFQKMQEKVTSDMFKSIKKAAAAYAKAHGYSAIIEEKGVLYVSDTLETKDLTDEITAELNEKGGK